MLSRGFAGRGLNSFSAQTLAASSSASQELDRSTVLSRLLPAPQPAKSSTAPLFPSLRARLQRRQESGPKPRSSSEFPGRSSVAESRGAGSTRSVLSHSLPAP